MVSTCPNICPYRQVNGYCQLTACINPWYVGLRYSATTDWRAPKTYINYTIYDNRTEKMEVENDKG